MAIHLPKSYERQLRSQGLLPPAKSKPRGMNKLEAEYAAYLDGLQRTGVIIWWAWEAIKLRLADRTWYTPDFVVIVNVGSNLEFREVKGFMRDDAAVKIKVAAEQFPWRFKIVRKEGNLWQHEVVPGRRS